MMLSFLSLIVASLTLRVTFAANCDIGTPPVTTNPFYKKFCGHHYKVGFSDDFKPYSWKVNATDKGDVPSDYATIDGWVGVDADTMDEIADFLGFNYTVVDIPHPQPGINECVIMLCLFVIWRD
jgi:hypothetical protein